MRDGLDFQANLLKILVKTSFHFFIGHKKYFGADSVRTESPHLAVTSWRTTQVMARGLPGLTARHCFRCSSAGSAARTFAGESIIALIRARPSFLLFAPPPVPTI